MVRLLKFWCDFVNLSLSGVMIKEMVLWCTVHYEDLDLVLLSVNAARICPFILLVVNPIGMIDESTCIYVSEQA